jgi:hypothetical protein
MGYSNFKTLKEVCEEYGLQAEYAKLFAEEYILPQNPSSWLEESLQMAYIFPLTSTQSQTERLVSPILLEAGKLFKENITLFSGDVEDEGFCFVLYPSRVFIDTPIFAVVVSRGKYMSLKMA